MQMQKIKKVASGALGLFLTGATLMGPALAAADLSDFQNMGPSDTVIVVGASAITADVVGGINIGGKLAQSGIESATCSVTCADVGAAKVTDGVKIETSSKKLYLDYATAANTNTLKKVKASLSENDLDLLAKQTIEYESGKTMTMNQVLDLTDNTKVQYNEKDPDAATDTPRLILYNANGQELYKLTLTFPTGLDVQSPDNTTTAGPGIAGQDMTILGKTFTVGVQSDISTTKLILFGGGEEKTLVAAGDAVSFELEGETHTIRMTSWTGTSASTPSTLKGVFELDGVTYTKAANTEIPIPGSDSKITVKKLEETKVPSAAGGAATEGAQATIFVGSAKLTLQDGVDVKKGDDTISGAVPTFSKSGTKINKIVISYKPDEEVTAEENVAYTDPVFGAFDFVLTGMTPSIEASSRDKIILAKNGKKVKLTAPMNDGNTLSLNVYQSDNTQKFTLKVDDKPFKINYTQSGVTKNDYLLVSDGEYSNILQYKTIETTDNLITLRDTNSGEDIEVSYSDSTSTGTMYIGSASYALSIIDETAKTFTLAAWGGSGTRTGNMPIVTRNGAVITLMSGANGVEFSEPAQINVSEIDVVETESNNDALDLIVNFTTKTTSSDIDDVAFAPALTDFKTIGDGDVSAGLTKYGTFVKRDTDADSLTLWYPDEQAYVNVYVMKSGVSPPTVGVEGATITETVSVEAPSLGSGIAKLDTETTAADKETKNLILVGGPAANKLVEDLATAGKTPDMAYWMSDLQGKYILQAVGDAFATGKTAIVVAGWEASDTQTASLKLATEDVSGAAVSCLGTTCEAFTYPAEEAPAEETPAEEEE